MSIFDMAKAGRSFVWENGELYCKCIPRRRALLRVSNSKANPGALYWTCAPGQPTSGRRQRCESFAWFDVLCAALPLTPAFIEEHKKGALRQIEAVATAVAAANNATSAAAADGGGGGGDGGEEEADRERERERRTPRKSGGPRKEVGSGPMDRWVTRAAENSEAGEQPERDSEVTPGTTPVRAAATTPGNAPNPANQPLKKPTANHTNSPTNSQFNDITDDVLQNIDLPISAAATPVHPSRKTINTPALKPRLLFIAAGAAASGSGSGSGGRPSPEKTMKPSPLQKPTSVQKLPPPPPPPPLQSPAAEPIARPTRAGPRGGGASHAAAPFRSAAATAIATSINNARTHSQPPQPVVPLKRPAPESWATPSEDSDPATQDFFQGEDCKDAHGDNAAAAAAAAGDDNAGDKVEGLLRKGEELPATAAATAVRARTSRRSVGEAVRPEAQAPPAQPQPLLKKRSSSSSLRRTRSVTFEDLTPIYTQPPPRANTNKPRTGNYPPTQRFPLAVSTAASSSTSMASSAAPMTTATNRPTADLQALNRQNQARAFTRQQSYSEVPPSPSRMTKRFCATGAGTGAGSTSSSSSRSNSTVGTVSTAANAARPSTIHSTQAASKTPAAAVPTSIIPTPTSAQPLDAAAQSSPEKSASLEPPTDHAFYDHTNDWLAKRSNLIMKLLRDAPLRSDTLETVMTFIQGFAQDNRRLTQQLNDRDREIMALMQRIESKR